MMSSRGFESEIDEKVNIDLEESEPVDIPRCLGRLYDESMKICRHCFCSHLCFERGSSRGNSAPESQVLPLSLSVAAIILGQLREGPSTIVDLIELVKVKLRRGKSLVRPVLADMRRKGEVCCLKHHTRWLWRMTPDLKAPCASDGLLSERPHVEVTRDL